MLLWLKVAQCYAAIKENAEAICVYYRGNTGTHSISSNPLDSLTLSSLCSVCI